jgi:hypothetical protein
VLPTCYVSLTAAELKKVRSHNIGSYIGDIRGTGDSMVGKPLLQIASDTLSQSFFLFVFWCLFFVAVLGSELRASHQVGALPNPQPFLFSYFSDRFLCSCLPVCFM